MNHKGEVAILITSRHGRVSEGMEEYVQRKAGKLPRYNDQISRIEVVVVGPQEAPEVEMLVYLDNHEHLVARERSDTFHAAIDGLVEKIERQLVRVKEKLKDPKREQRPPLPEDSPPDEERFDDALRKSLDG